MRMQIHLMRTWLTGVGALTLARAVAVGAGEWRGVLALVMLASLWMVTVPFIPGADHEFFLRQVWRYEGIVLGVLIAAIRPSRVSSTALVGAGLYGVVIAARHCSRWFSLCLRR
jgi:hypothetical protein